jgi:gluconolactonase
MKSVFIISVSIVSLLCPAVVQAGVVAADANVLKLASVFAFTEGPAADPKGNVYFTDQPKDKIYIWSTEGKLSVFLTGCERSNGLYFDADGLSLLACADLHNRLISIDPNGKITVLAEKYNGKKFNATNDLWRDPKGGIYFTDPYYKRSYWADPNMGQDGEHVYYLAPDRKTVTRVADDLVKPNGIIGSADGKLLYIADIGDNKTYVYTINADGTLSDKKLFCKLGSDGMTIDNEGNVYLTGKGVTVFNSAGEQIDHIDINESWTANVCFGGKDQDTLFITASKSLYLVKMRTRGVTWPASVKRSEDGPAATKKNFVVVPGAEIKKLADGFSFTEGPVADAQGDIYFTDIPNNRIHKWSSEKIATFRENTNGANGLNIDDKGNLYVCEGGGRRISRIDPGGNVTVLCDNYKGKKLNAPNDLWRDKKGGIYFSDPINKKEESELARGYVFYLPADSKDPIIVIDDMVSPNGVVGTKDGTLLYVADYGANRTWVYKIKDDGTLSDKKLFAPVGADGMELDELGNLYMADLSGKGISVVNPEGKKIDYIDVPKPPSNICFGGKDGKTLFITARDSLYSIQMSVKGQ